MVQQEGHPGGQMAPVSNARHSAWKPNGIKVESRQAAGERRSEPTVHY